MKHDEYGLPVKRGRGRPRGPMRITKLQSVDTLNFNGRHGTVSWPEAFKGLSVDQVHTVSEIISADKFNEDTEHKFYRKQSEAIRKAKMRAIKLSPTIKLRSFQTYRNRQRNPDGTVTLSVTLRRMS